MNVLARIKRCALLHNVRFTAKADGERLLDDLTELEVLESLVNARKIEKTLRSTTPKTRQREYLYIIKSPTARGEFVYTKGKLDEYNGVEVYYLLISAKLAE